MTNEHRGKIAFIFPANAESGTLKPTLNFKVRGDTLAITMGISFIDLNAESAYLVKLSVTSPAGEILLDNGMDAIPPQNIDPAKRTSFLAANMYLISRVPGMHCFRCELIEMMQTTVDKQEIYFNVFREDGHEPA